MAPRPKHALLVHGTALVLLGLLSGALLPVVTNPRMGLSAHLGGVMNGMLTLILAVAWPYARLTERLDRTTTWLVLYSMYAIWGSTVLGAVFGTSEATPIAGAGFSGSAWQEGLVTTGLTTGAIAILAATVVLLYGFSQARTREEDASS